MADASGGTAHGASMDGPTYRALQAQPSLHGFCANRPVADTDHLGLIHSTCLQNYRRCLSHAMSVGLRCFYEDAGLAAQGSVFLTCGVFCAVVCEGSISPWQWLNCKTCWIGCLGGASISEAIKAKACWDYYAGQMAGCDPILENCRECYPSSGR